MGKQYLTDSNSVIDFLSGKITGKGVGFMNNLINSIPRISVITKIEVLGFNTTKEAHQLLTDFIDDSIIFGLTEDVVEQTIKIRKNNKIKIPDAIIAATAIVHSLTIITRNTKDFEKIKGLKVINPYEL